MSKCFSQIKNIKLVSLCCIALLGLVVLILGQLIARPRLIASDKTNISKQVSANIPVRQLGDVIALPIPDGLNTLEFNIGVTGVLTKADYIAEYLSWKEVQKVAPRLLSAKLIDPVTQSEARVFLATRANSSLISRGKAGLFRLFALRFDGALIELDSQRQPWRKGLLLDVPLSQVFGTSGKIISQLSPEAFPAFTTEGQSLLKASANSLPKLPIYILEGSSEAQSINVRLDSFGNNKEPLLISIYARSPKLSKAKARIERLAVNSTARAATLNKSGEQASQELLVASYTLSFPAGDEAVLGLVQSSNSASLAASSVSISSTSTSVISSIASQSSTVSTTTTSSISESLSSTYSESSQSPSSSSSSHSTTSTSSSVSSSTRSSDSSTTRTSVSSSISSSRSSSTSTSVSSSTSSTMLSCKCPYRTILIGGQGGTLDHPIFKDLSGVLPGAVNIALNPGEGQPDDTKGAMDKAKAQIEANKPYKTLVVAFSLGGALAINEFAGKECVDVYTIDPPIHMNPLICNDFYGLFDSRCRQLEKAEDCMKTNPPNVDCYWCTAGKCFPAKDHDPFTFQNKDRIEEIKRQIKELMKCK